MSQRSVPCDPFGGGSRRRAPCETGRTYPSAPSRTYARTTASMGRVRAPVAPDCCFEAKGAVRPTRRSAVEATACGQPQPRDRLTLAWLPSAAGGNAEPAKPRLRKVADPIARSGVGGMTKAIAGDPSRNRFSRRKRGSRFGAPPHDGTSAAPTAATAYLPPHGRPGPELPVHAIRFCHGRLRSSRIVPATLDSTAHMIDRSGLAGEPAYSTYSEWAPILDASEIDVVSAGIVTYGLEGSVKIDAQGL